MDFIGMGQRIREKRKAYMITQEVLAEKLGISVEYMSRVENGNVRASLTLLEKISRVLDISEEELILGKREENEDRFCSEFRRLPEGKKKAVLKMIKIISEI